MSKDLIITKMTVERNNEEVKVSVEGYVDFSIDRRYGEDADGGRGECRVVINDIIDVIAYDADGDTFNLSDDEKEESLELIGEKFLMG